MADNLTELILKAGNFAKEISLQISKDIPNEDRYYILTGKLKQKFPNLEEEQINTIAGEYSLLNNQMNPLLEEKIETLSKKTPNKMKPMTIFYIIAAGAAVLFLYNLKKNFIDNSKISQRPAEIHQTENITAKPIVPPVVQQPQEIPEEKPSQLEETTKTINPKYDKNSYGNIKEWVNAGDLEVMVNKSTTSILDKRGTYNKWEISANVDIKNCSENYFHLIASDFFLNFGDSQEDFYIGFGAQLEYLPPQKIINKDYFFKVLGREGETPRFSLRKVKIFGNNCFEKCEGRTYINLENIPEVNPN